MPTVLVHSVFTLALWSLAAVPVPIDALAAAAPPLAAGKSEPAPKAKDDKPSYAEYVAQLQRAITADRKQLEALKAQKDDPQSEYHQAEAEFNRLDAQWSEVKKKVQELRQAGKRAGADRLETANKLLAEEWQAAKDRFDLAIEERQTLREKVAALTEKTERDEFALEQLTGSSDPDPKPAPVTKPASDAAQPAADHASDAKPAESSNQPAAAAAKPDQAASESEDEELDQELVKARQQAKTLQSAAHEADDRAQSLNERFETLRKNIAVEQRLLDLSRARSDQTQAARKLLDKELQQALIEHPNDLEDIWKRIALADKRLFDARAETRATHDRLDELRKQLDALQAEQLEALQAAKQTHAAAEAAEDMVARLQNPFTLHNVLQWGITHGPKLAGIVLATLVLQLLVKVLGRQIAQIMARGSSRGTLHERENRALTLVGVFRNTASIVILGGGTLMTLDEIGIPIGPLMGGAAVVGLAVAFGAQNLIRDYFSGFMVLLEDQYGINDVVRIGETAGVVEKITLRITVLRDSEGAVHFIPHGSITNVSNLTHGWSRALVEIGISHKEDPDQVIRVLSEVANDLRRDPAFARFILADPDMMGLDNISDSALIIKFSLKTQPLKRWPVRRELLRRIKLKFDELGIEFPNPSRTVVAFPEGVEDHVKSAVHAARRLGKTA